MSSYVDSIANFFDRLSPSNLKIYQDGLMIDGSLGKKIIEGGARKGSKNHKIVRKLMQKGAKIMKKDS